MPVDATGLAKSIAAIEKNYGEKSVIYGNEEPKVDRIPTGSLGIDYATGGGIPLGRISRFYGPYSSGKSLTCWNVIKNAQAMGLSCAYYNMEKQYHRDFVKAHGVDIDKLLVVQGTTIEETGAKCQALLGSVHVHVLDSLSAAISIDELNADIEQWQMALSARAWGKVLRRLNHEMDKNENVIIMVDQVRSSFGMGADEPPGGRAIEHASSMTLSFRRATWLYKDDNDTLDPDASPRPTLAGVTDPDGIEMLVNCKKSRVSRPLRTGRARLDFTNMEFDHVWEMTNALIYFKKVEKTTPNSSYYKLPDGTTAQGARKLREAVAKDKDLQKLATKTMKENW